MEKQLARNFLRREFACRCGCGLASPAPSLVEGLQALRNMIGRPLDVVSGCRCKHHNKKEGGADQSQHLPDAEGICHAADVRAADMTPRDLYAHAAALCRFGGFGVDDERGTLHLDDRERLARWCYRGGKQAPWSGAPAPGPIA